MEISRCCVCKQEANCFTVKSTCSDAVLNYCPACVSQGYENYDELVQYGFPFKLFSKQYREKVVKPTLQYYNKSIEQFNKDVEQILHRGNDNDT